MSISLVSPPEILTHPTSSRVAFYSNVQFKCVAKGYGLVSVVWKKTGSQRLPFTARVTNTTDINEITSVLTITEVIGYYSGQYLCEAKNNAGITTTSSLATLHVNGMYVHTYVRSYIRWIFHAMLTATVTTYKCHIIRTYIYVLRGFNCWSMVLINILTPSYDTKVHNILTILAM